MLADLESIFGSDAMTTGTALELAAVMMEGVTVKVDDAGVGKVASLRLVINDVRNVVWADEAIIELEVLSKEAR